MMSTRSITNFKLPSSSQISTKSYNNHLATTDQRYCMNSDHAENLVNKSEISLRIESASQEEKLHERLKNYRVQLFDMGVSDPSP